MSEFQDVRAAVLTAPSPGAIAVVALAGNGALAMSRNILFRAKSNNHPELLANEPRLCRIMEDGAVLDDAIVVFDPREGAEYVEIHPHGGVRIVERLLALLSTKGANVVTGSELDSLVGRSSLIEHDVDDAILRSGSRKLTQWLLAQRSSLPDFLNRWSSVSSNEKQAYIERTRAAIRLVRGIRIALVGPPNVGKSTLANRLIGRDRVLTSDIAGTTRDWVDEQVSIDGWPMTIVDTAGIRITACEIESEAISRGAIQSQSADVILRMDIDDSAASIESRSISPQSNKSETNDGKPVELSVINKIDMSDERKNATLPTPDSVNHHYHRISALRGDGIDQLTRAICMTLSLNLLEASRPTGFLTTHIPSSNTTKYKFEK